MKAEIQKGMGDKMDIIIVAQYMGNVAELNAGNSRFFYIAKMLKQMGHKVEILTSDFCHEKKSHFGKINRSEDIAITTCHEKGYSRNVCLNRFVSHRELAKNIERYLLKRPVPDVIYCAIPSIDVSAVAAKYCEKQQVKFIVDIQDLWPEAFKLVMKIPIINDLVFYPMTRKINYVYSVADEIVAVSQTYVDRGLAVNKKCNQGHAVFLGTELSRFDNYSDNIKKEMSIIKLAYCGTLGHSYDLKSTFDALKMLADQHVPYEFVVMGDGPLMSSFKEYVNRLDLNVVFTGRMPYPKMVKRLSQCDICINPIMHGAAQSIINKHADYVAAGKPIISTQESEEWRQLIDSYNMGINCRNGAPEEIEKAIYKLTMDEELRTRMGLNARRCAEEKFDRAITYKEIVDTIIKSKKRKMK